MCRWGTHTVVRVKIASELSHTGEDRWKDVAIDACIAVLVRELQLAGVDMLASCCGHGVEDGRIDLRDGTIIRIPKTQARDWFAWHPDQTAPERLHAPPEAGQRPCLKCADLERENASLRSAVDIAIASVKAEAGQSQAQHIRRVLAEMEKTASHLFTGEKMAVALHSWVRQLEAALSAREQSDWVHHGQILDLVVYHAKTALDAARRTISADHPVREHIDGSIKEIDYLKSLPRRVDEHLAECSEAGVTAEAGQRQEER